jgi:hypothetical protein
MAALVELFARNVSEAEKRYRELAQKDPLGGVKGGFYNAVDYRSALACLQILNGHAEQARPSLLATLAAEEKHLTSCPTDPAGHYRKAALKAMLGENGQALADLRRAFEAGWIDYRATNLDPRFDSIAQTPEFKAILSEAARHVETLAKQTSRMAFTDNPK